MESSKFWERFAALCKKEGKSPSAVGEIVGVPKSTMTWWRKGKLPHANTLNKIADHFSVSVGYLLGEEAEKPQKENAPTEEALKVALFGGADVPDELWDKVTEYAKFLVEQDKRNRK